VFWLTNLKLKTFFQKRIGPFTLADLISVGLGQGAALLFGFGTIKVLTTMYGPEKYGEFAIALTIAGILNSFIYGPLANATSRFVVPCEENGQLDPLIHAVMKMVLYAGLGAGICVLMLMISKDFIPIPIDLSLISIGIAYGVLSGNNAIFLSIFNARQERTAYALLQALDASLRGILAIFAVVYLQDSPFLGISGYTIGALLVGIICFVVLKKRKVNFWYGLPNASSEKSIVTLSSQVSSYAKPFVGWAAISVLCNYGDRWILGIFSNEHEVGMYYALFQIGSTPINFLAGIFSMIFVPKLFASAGDGHSLDRIILADKLLEKSCRVQALCMIAVMITFLLLGDKIALLLTNRDFASRSYLLFPVAISTSLVQVARFLATRGMYLGQHVAYFRSLMYQSIVFIMMGAPFAYLYGAAGLAATALISSTFYLLHIVSTNKRLKCHSAL
jgi:O-antigen/teichoic acid export membrane protein